jgi:hypothetical protein
MAAGSRGLLWFSFVLAFMTVVAHAADKVRLAVTDIEGMEKLQQEFGPFREA